MGFTGFRAHGLVWPLSAAFLAGHLTFQILVFAFKIVIIIYLLFLLHGPPTGLNELKIVTKCFITFKDNKNVR